MSYSVVVAEDEPLLLENLVQKINRSGTGFEVVGSAQTGVQAYDLVEEHDPWLLITDIRMPVMDGLELIQKVRESHPDLDCIIVSGYSEFEYAQAALHYQVKEYLLKPVDEEELKTALGNLAKSYAVRKAALENVFSSGDALKSPAEIAQLLKEYIIRHFNEEINLNLIATNLNYSSSYLTKIFCQQYDTTPSRFLIALRIQKAKQLLDHHYELNIRQVGEAVGYPEQAYFSRIFKKITGISPMDYLNERQDHKDKQS